jgi:hypothetical protein
MDFDTTISTLTARGFKFHVFQDYGQHNDKRGHSQSFGDYASASRHARKVPAGIVYDAKGKDVTYCL